MRGIREKLATIFEAEHAEHLEQIRALLAVLENVPQARGTTELDEAFRRAHSLKGAARAVDLQPVEGLAKGLETMFSRVRDGTLPLDKKMAAVVHRVLDSSEDCLAAFRENRAPEEPVGALQAMGELLGVQPVKVEIRTRTAENGSENENVPSATPVQSAGMVRLPGEDLDRLVRTTGEILAESFRQKTVTDELVALTRQIAEMEVACQRFRITFAGPLRRLRRMAEFSGVAGQIGFVEQKVRLLAGASVRVRLLQQRSARNTHLSAEQLQRDAWNARMAPAEDLFEGFRRMVRELAREEKKEIDFRLSGSGVRADRMVLQAIKDPVMHLLRNAISHGIETPLERERKGKPPVGTLTLRIESQRARLILQVEDDGQGVDFKTVARVAADRGLLPKAATSSLQDLERQDLERQDLERQDLERQDLERQDLGRIIFEPGFSTSPTVTDLSGRGMGLSVVFETARRLQGEASLQQKEGPGTSIRISVPLSVSTCHVLLVSCQGQTFGIPSHAIDRLHRIALEQVKTMEGKPVISLGKSQIPLFSLAHLLGIAAAAESFTGDILPIVLLRSGAKLCAVLVDAFLGHQDALIRELGMPYPVTGHVSGGALHPEGSVYLVLNPASLVEACTKSAALALRSTKQATAAAPFSILVVDDSITTRTLEKSILEAHGYRVRVAVDGIEALQSLRAHKADLIVTDIQMPRLDGFGLLAALKADKDLDRIPVIIVSSVEQAEEQERGLRLGADAYVVKRNFDQKELLAVIGQIL